MITNKKANYRQQTLRYWTVSQSIHPHCNTEVLKVVQKLAKRFELFEIDADFFSESVKQPLENNGVLLHTEVSIPKENLGEVHFSDFVQPSSEFVELELQNFGL